MGVKDDAKSLINSSIFGSSLARWTNDMGIAGELTRLVVPTSDGPFDVLACCAQLRGLAGVVATSRPRLTELFRDMGRSELAVMSYVAQDVEGYSLAIKGRWAALNNHLFLSAQHDGAPIALSASTSVATACLELSFIGSHLLGYELTVTSKPMTDNPLHPIAYHPRTAPPPPP